MRFAEGGNRGNQRSDLVEFDFSFFLGGSFFCAWVSSLLEGTFSFLLGGVSNSFLVGGSSLLEGTFFFFWGGVQFLFAGGSLLEGTPPPDTMGLLIGPST